ncbi:glycosyltransferase [Methylobacterium sp. A54F]
MATPERLPGGGGEGLDALRFLLAPGPSRLARLVAGLRIALSHPGEVIAILRARLSGKRLRARQSAAALFGIDHRLDLRVPEDRLAAEASDGSVHLILPAGHSLLPGATARLGAAFAARPDWQALYGDALVQRAPGGPVTPILRPAFDPDYLLGIDYIGPVLALRAPPEPGESAYAACLRIAARHGAGAVGHIPVPLTLWRPEMSGHAEAARAGRLRAARAYLDRTGEGASGIALDGDGIATVLRPLPEPRPCVSLIVPTRDRLDLLRTCLDSLTGCTDWPDFEILVCDNDSREPETLAYFRALEAEGQARVIPCPGPFDFAAMNNRAAAAARGRLLGFINNDVEAFRPDWLARLCSEALRPEVGAVGARLLDGAGRIQHGGIVLGTGGLVTHAHRHFPGDAAGYLSGLRATRRVSAVTAACLLVERAKFLAVGGFDAAHFAVDFNDVDLCLRLDAAGHRTLFVPGAVLHHREAASRRWTREARARHLREVAAFKTRWGSLLAQDPHYQPGFDPNLSTHARLRPGLTLPDGRSADY